MIQFEVEPWTDLRRLTLGEHQEVILWKISRKEEGSVGMEAVEGRLAEAVVDRCGRR